MPYNKYVSKTGGHFMKIKYFLAGLLCVCLGTSIMTACANPQSAQSSEAQKVKTEKLHKLYIRAPKEFT